MREAPLKWARPFLLDEVCAGFPDLTIMIAHLGHPWIDEAIAVARKHPRLFLDISALFTRPWQLYTGLIGVQEYGIAGKILSGPTSRSSRRSRRRTRCAPCQAGTRGTPLPAISRDWIEEIIERDTGAARSGVSASGGAGVNA